MIMIIIFQPARGGLTKGGEGHYFNEYDKKISSSFNISSKTLTFYIMFYCVTINLPNLYCDS